MTADQTPPVLWLRRPSELTGPPSKFALLWPAIEYTALVFGRSSSASNIASLNLDPFERAIYGASAAKVVSIREQAEILDLNPNFVAHIHERLMERGVFDDYSRPRAAITALADDEVIMATRIYQDPWSGSLWPRYVTDDGRRTVPVVSDRGRLRIAIGTTGSPIEIRALYLNRPLPERSAPSSDDAVSVFVEWSRLQRSHRIPGGTVPKHPAARVLTDSRELVLLCCPNDRARGGRPQVHDPFGGPEWSPFARALVVQADEVGVLKNWLFGPGDHDDPRELRATTSELNTASLRDRLATILGGLDTGVEGRALNPQGRLDLEAVGQDALDVLWLAAVQSPRELVSDPLTDEALLRQIALTVGFVPTDITVPLDLESLAEGQRGSLLDRCVALLLLFPADRFGPLHKLAQHEPLLFQTLRVVDDHAEAPMTDDLRAAVQALVSTAEWSAEPSTQIGTQHV